MCVTEGGNRHSSERPGLLDVRWSKVRWKKQGRKSTAIRVVEELPRGVNVVLDRADDSFALAEITIDRRKEICYALPELAVEHAVLENLDLAREVGCM